MTTYATLTDLTLYGIAATALGDPTTGPVPTAVRQAALDAASKVVDSFYRGRYPLPLLAWDIETTQATCKIAAWELLNIRGYNPASGADVNIRDRYQDAMGWLNRVQRQAAHPNVTPSAAQVQYTQPMVITSSVVDLATGATARNRGW